MNRFNAEIASKSDLEQILSLQKKAYLSEAEIYDDYTIPPLHQSDEDIEEEFKRGLFLKVASGGVMIGSVRAYEEAGICHIGKLIVKPGHQNKGIGGMLLQKIESRFSNAISYELFTGIDSVKNLHIYQKNGYAISYQKEVSPSLTMVFLRKQNDKDIG